MLLEGLQLPLTTPFYLDGRLNLRKLEHNVERYSKTPVAGLVALSETGESSLLSDEENRQVLRAAIDAAAVEKVMIAGVSRDSVLGTLELAEYAAGAGYDAVLVREPSFFRGGSRGSFRGNKAKELLTYFQAVADRSSLPVVLDGAGAELAADLVIELAGHPQIIGLVEGGFGSRRLEILKAGTASVKRSVTVTAMFAAATGRMLGRSEGSGDFISSATLTVGGAAVAAPKVAVKTRTKVVGFQILAGKTAGMLDALLAGAVGAVPAFSAAAPQACYEVFAAWKDGDEGLAREKQARLQVVAERVEVELGVPCIKFGCDLNGYFGGLPRLPLLPPTGDERSEIQALMQGLRN
ncbi:MAG TPA: dihydrodipicolinate synthase family protein [Edaphobacter sp.]|nr:dihydrodipicolinate synthase family protein [Edaphobacter sp.]